MKTQNTKLIEPDLHDGVDITPKAIVKNIIRKLKECDSDLRLLPRIDMRVGGAMQHCREAIALLKSTQWSGQKDPFKGKNVARVTLKNLKQFKPYLK